MIKPIYRISLVIALFFCAVSERSVAQGNRSPILSWAYKLEQNITCQNTEYRHKDDNVVWGDSPANTQCYTDCSGFINALIAKTYSWNDDNFKTELGHKRMYAWHYFDAITSGRHFQQIKNIGSILPGDIIALKYADRSEHEDNTGHVMVIASLPRPRKASKVFEPNTNQYEVEVIDCSKSPHGKSDSRHTPDGGEYSGLGRGLFRLYADEQGTIVAYSWSIGNPKADFNPFENPVVVGRFISPN